MNINVELAKSLISSIEGGTLISSRQFLSALGCENSDAGEDQIMVIAYSILKIAVDMHGSADRKR